MINPNNAMQTALRDPAVNDVEPDNLEFFGLDRDGPVPSEEASDVIVVPPTCPISQDSLLLLQRNVDPLRNSDFFSIDLYLSGISIVLGYNNNIAHNQ